MFFVRFWRCAHPGARWKSHICISRRSPSDTPPTRNLNPQPRNPGTTRPATETKTQNPKPLTLSGFNRKAHTLRGLASPRTRNTQIVCAGVAEFRANLSAKVAGKSVRGSSVRVERSYCLLLHVCFPIIWNCIIKASKKLKPSSPVTLAARNRVAACMFKARLRLSTFMSSLFRFNSKLCRHTLWANVRRTPRCNTLGYHTSTMCPIEYVSFRPRKSNWGVR